MRTNSEKLRDMLLKIGGKETFIEDDDPDFRNYFQRGVLLDRESDILLIGELCQCHKNSINLWSTNKNKYRMMTGYAMSSHGNWHQHSWLIDENDNIIETTAKREKYYGYILTESEAEDFLITYSSQK